MKSSKYFFVKVSNDALMFSAAHFLFSENKCERLHGHNFLVTFEIGGLPDSSGMVYDLLAIKSNVQSFCKDLDHKILLPAKSSLLKITNTSSQVHIYYLDKKEYSFPKIDVILLPIKTTTLEEILSYLLQRFLEISVLPSNVKKIRISIEEMPGHSVVLIRDLN